MTDSNRSAMMRKLSSGSMAMNSAPRSVMRALRLSLSRSADDLLKLPLSVIGAKQVVRAQDELAGIFPEGWLLLQFAGPGGAAAVCLDTGCVSALVQMQTMAQVLREAPQNRGFTDTDAAMAAPLFEDVFVRARDLVEDSADIDLLSGLEFACRAEDTLGLSHVLTEDSYRIYNLTVELAGGVRQGQVLLVLSEITVRDEDKHCAGPPCGSTLGTAASVIRADLQAIICRMEVPLSQLSNWDPGNVVPLPRTRLDRTELTTIDRTRAGIGRLGQCGGMRAVRINEQSYALATTVVEQPEFTEATSIGVTPIPDTNQSSIVSPEGMTASIPGGIDDAIEHESGAMPSDRIVDEITQLAGLTGPDDLQDQS